MTQLAKDFLRKYESGVWNTGNGYTEFGQRIAAVMLPNKHVYFVDIDRNIDGVTVMPITCQYTSMQEFVKYAYDYGHYNGGYYDMKATLPHLGYDGMGFVRKVLEAAAESVGGGVRDPRWQRKINVDACIKEVENA